MLKFWSQKSTSNKNGGMMVTLEEKTQTPVGWFKSVAFAIGKRYVSQGKHEKAGKDNEL